MTDKKRQYQRTYMDRKAKRGYVLRQLFIHKSLLDEVKQLIQRRHKNVELQALLAEIRKETPQAAAAAIIT